MKFEVIKGETDQITYSGKRVRRQTTLIKIGKYSLSRKVIFLGSALIFCQVLDGLLTYAGLTVLGVHMEGNLFLRALINAYGKAPVLFFTKLAAVGFVVLLTFQAHQRRWIRPIIALLILIYLGLAVGPWTYIIWNTQRDSGVAAQAVSK